MKKLLFLLFGALFALAGCADESGTNGGNTETCPITSADFSYERVAQNKYKMKLIDESKRQYAGSARWALYNDNVMYDKNNIIEATITFLEPLNKKELVFYHNDKKCGDNIILKPSPSCDNITINYWQKVSYGSMQFPDDVPVSNFYVQFHDINQLDNNLTYTIKFTDNQTLERVPDTISNNSIVFRTKRDNIAHLRQSIVDGIYADLIIDYPNGSQCVKEVFFKNMF